MRRHLQGPGPPQISLLVRKPPTSLRQSEVAGFSAGDIHLRATHPASLWRSPGAGTGLAHRLRNSSWMEGKAFSHY